jgi:DNA invertase Pin-like site-specific DNA recombinase
MSKTKRSYDDTNIDYIDVNLTNINLQNKRAIIYARCSSNRQTTDGKDSLSNQFGICMEYCNKQRLDIIDVIEDIYSGHDISCLTINKIFDSNENNGINIVICDPSRLSRNVSNAFQFLEKCRSHNIRLHFVRDNLTNDTNEECKKILGLVYDAYNETNVLKKRLKSTFAMKKRLGSYLGKPSYGFDIVTKNDNYSKIAIRSLVLNKDEQLVIDVIKKLYYGSTMVEFYTIFRRLTKNNNFKLKDIRGNELDYIYYGNINTSDIKDLLNENDITYRGKEWTTRMIRSIINRFSSDNSIMYDPNIVYIV